MRTEVSPMRPARRAIQIPPKRRGSNVSRLRQERSGSIMDHSSDGSNLESVLLDAWDTFQEPFIQLESILPKQQGVTCPDKESSALYEISRDECANRKSVERKKLRPGIRISMPSSKMSGESIKSFDHRSGRDEPPKLAEANVVSDQNTY